MNVLGPDEQPPTTNEALLAMTAAEPVVPDDAVEAALPILAVVPDIGAVSPARVRAALAAATPALTHAAVDAERERIATAIEAAYENWRTLAAPDHLLPEKARLHSTQWFVERVYADAACIARQETP